MDIDCEAVVGADQEGGRSNVSKVKAQQLKPTQDNQSSNVEMNFSCHNPAQKVLHQQGNIPAALSKQTKVWDK